MRALGVGSAGEGTLSGSGRSCSNHIGYTHVTCACMQGRRLAGPGNAQVREERHMCDCV